LANGLKRFGKAVIKKEPIRVVLCSYPGIFSVIVKKILQKTPGINLIGLVYSQRIFSKSESWFQGAGRLLKISGFKYALLQFMQTDMCRILISLLQGQDSEVIPVLETKNINDDQGKEFLSGLNPEVILLANFNQKLSSTIIELPKLACLNIHPSLLPRFKGVDPVFAALNAEESKLGVSLHHVAPEFDTGDLMAQATIPAEKNHSAFYHQVKLFKLGAELAADNIKDMPDKINKQPQQGDGGYDSWPSKRQIKSFNQRGGALIKMSEFVQTLKMTLAMYD